MKKIFYFMSLAAVVFAMASCKDKETEPIPQDEKVIPQQIRLADAFQEYFMSEGETALIQYTVTPSNVNVTYTLAWKSSDEKVVKVDSKGKVTAVAAGSATVTVSINEYPEVKPAVASITILAPAKVGDYIYNDGSWSENPNPDGKKVIAVIYWLGNASLFDPILEVDYPNCTHGLAMSLKQGKAGEWMKDFYEYLFNTDDLSDYYHRYINTANGPYCDNSGSLTEWGVTHSSYAELIRPYFENEDLWAGNLFPGLGGYTYTAVLEQYTREHDPEGRFPFEFYLNGMNLVKDIEAPLTTSRWYMPSVFEAALMVNTALTKPGDFNNDKVDGDLNPLVQHNNANMAVVNAALGKVQGADLLPAEEGSAIASATDAYRPFSSISTKYDCATIFELMALTQGSDDANADQYWEEWLKANAGDKYEEYKTYHRGEYVNRWGSISESNKSDDRIDVYLMVKGIDLMTGDRYTGVEIKDILLNVAGSMWEASVYGNVSTTTGKLQWYFDGINEYASGMKGKSNPKDVVRAIIAF